MEAKNDKTRILFVCHGNICRSPMAEMVMKHLVRAAGCADEFEIASAATHNDAIGWDIHRGTREELARRGVACESRAARLLSAADGAAWDVIAVMDEENVRHARRILGAAARGKVRKLLEWCGETRDVADPWYTGDFNATYRDVEAGCRAMLEDLNRGGK